MIWTPITSLAALMYRRTTDSMSVCSPVGLALDSDDPDLSFLGDLRAVDCVTYFNMYKYVYCYTYTFV